MGVEMYESIIKIIEKENKIILDKYIETNNIIEKIFNSIPTIGENFSPTYHKDKISLENLKKSLYT